MDESLQIDYKLLLNAIKNPVFVHDTEFNIIFVNEFYRKISKKPLSDILYHPYWESFPKRTGPLPGCLEALRTGHAITEKITADNGKIYQSHSFPVKNNAGQFQYSVHIFTDITELERKSKHIEEINEALNNTLVDSIKSIGLAIEQRDPYTAGHQYRVSLLATAVAKEMQLESDVIDGIRLGALIHDIGKIRIPAEILSTPRALLKEEYDLIKRHVSFGFEIINAISFPWPIGKIIMQHHERLDGSGYPYGLRSDDIMLETQIVSVADVFDAMTSGRPYRETRNLSETIKELKDGANTKYNEKAVFHCIDLITNQNFKFPVTHYK